MFGFFKRLFKKNTITITEKGKDTLISLSSAKSTIKIGATLIVPENFTAFMVVKKNVFDNFNAGTHKLTSATMPLLAKELRLNKENSQGKLPSKFKADIYYINLNDFFDVEFINPNKLVIKDKRFLKAKVGFKGKFAFKTFNAEDLLAILLKDMGSIKGHMALDRLRYYVAFYTGKKIKKNKPGLEELFNRESDCFKGLLEFVSKKFKDAGIEITSIEITDVLLPKKVYKKTDLSFLEIDTNKQLVENQIEGANLTQKLTQDAISNKLIAENNLMAIESSDGKSIQYKKCEKCNSVNPSQAKFCFNCANPFKKTCQNCGASLNENDFVCKNCKSIVV